MADQPSSGENPLSRPVVYISGPITKGDRSDNLHQAHKAHAELMRRGFAPINPMLSMQLPFAWNEEFAHHVWLECDLPIVARSDAVLRLPGESRGADQETRFAQSQGIPIFTTLGQLEEWKETTWITPPLRRIAIYSDANVERAKSASLLERLNRIMGKRRKL